MFLFFKNTVKKLKFRYTFYDLVNLNKLSVSKQQYLCLNKLSIIIGGTQIITNERKTHLFYKIIHFSVQFSAIVNRFIVKA